MKPHQVNWNSIEWTSTRGGMERKTFSGEGATLALHRIQPGHELKPHSHHYEQIVYMLKGTAIFHVDGRPWPLEAGSLIVIPPNAVHYIEVTGTDEVLELDIFTPKRPEYGG